MFKQEIKTMLKNIYSELEMIRDTEFAEDHPQLLFDINNSMSSINAALDDLKAGK